MVDPATGVYENFSGCGNTVSCNHPVVRSLIMDALRYWVTEMHVDGFRFDLASILGRGQNGEVLANPPLLERIAAEPVLANIKLIAEAWDAAGLYQVGSFPNWGRWAEWNGHFRDDIRRFVKGDPGLVPVLATRLAGSSDLYQHDGRAPYHSVNFITSHDGFTLYDLVSYEEKHNEANGQDNQDGHSEHFSWHCGIEGPTVSAPIQRLRRQQMKNMVALLLLSQGVPMILSGDEFGRTQQGNNNAFCQDNGLSWIDWTQKKDHEELFHFFKQLIAFRKAHAILRRHEFFEPDAVPTITWHGFQQGKPDWTEASGSIGMHLVTEEEVQDLYKIAHAINKDQDFELPVLPASSCWVRVLDTGLPPPHDIVEVGREAEVESQSVYKVSGRSVVVLLQKTSNLL
jgi:isoamylase